MTLALLAVALGALLLAVLRRRPAVVGLPITPELDEPW